MNHFTPQQVHTYRRSISERMVAAPWRPPIGVFPQTFPREGPVAGTLPGSGYRTVKGSFWPAA